MWANVKALWRDRQVHGLELLFDTLLLVLRYLSISYWLKRFFPGPDDPKHTVGDNAIDVYCVVQLLALLILLPFGLGPVADSFIASYILFDIYLNLFNIVFIGKMRAINAPPVSIERSILLLFMNVLEVVLAFAIFYRDWLKLSTMDAIFNAVLVLGTIGYPAAADGQFALLVSFQVLLDFILIVLVISSFVGHVGLFRSTTGSGGTSPPNDPLQTDR